MQKSPLLTLFEQWASRSRETFRVTSRSKSPRKIREFTEGQIYNLTKLMEEVNTSFFNGKIEARITWGRDTSKRAVRSRRLGSYRREDNLIVIHPLLDNQDIPREVISFVVFHEMLHTLQPKGVKPHNASFRQALRSHPDYNGVMKWQKENRELILGNK